MYCEKCGHPNENDAKFCENCGNPLNNKKIESLRKCPNCGKTYQKEDKFCESCGTSLKADKEKSDTQRLKAYNEENIKNKPIQQENAEDTSYNSMEKPSSKGKIIIFALVGIFLLVLIIGGASYFINNGENSDELVYSEEIEDSDYGAILRKAKDLTDDSQYESALDILGEIPESAGDNYRKAQKQKNIIESYIVDELVEYYNNKDYETAKSLSDSYLTFLPNSKDIKEINDRSAKKLEKEDSKEKSLEERKADLSKDYDLDNLIYNDQWDKNGNPSYVEFYRPDDFLGKDLTVNISAGQLKDSPSINAPRIGQVERGEVVHVEDTESDGTRYWLYIGKGWISSKLITGEFASE